MHVYTFLFLLKAFCRIVPNSPSLSCGGGRGFEWKITVLDSDLPLPWLKQEQLQLATASFRDFRATY